MGQFVDRYIRLDRTVSDVINAEQLRLVKLLITTSSRTLALSVKPGSNAVFRGRCRTFRSDPLASLGHMALDEFQF